MSQKICLFSAFCFILSALPFISLYAQPGWIQNYQPFYTPYYDYDYEAGNIRVMDDGSFVVNGTCLEYDPDMGYYSNFGYLIKFDPEGNIMWAKKDSLNNSPSTWECESETFAIMPDGGFVSAGCVGLINPDYLLFRDSDGNLENIIYYNDMNFKSMCVVDNGNALLFGGSSGGATLQKTDLDGNEIWRKNYSEFNSTSIVSVIQINDGGYAFLSFTLSNFDYCLVKTDSSGTVEWYNTYDYNEQGEIPNSLIQTSDNGYLLCGYTNQNPGTDGDGGFIVKTDSVGDTLWTKKYDIQTTESAIENEDGYLLFGFNANGSCLRQIDNFSDTIWYKQIQISNRYSSNAEICFNSLYDGYIIYLQGNWAVDDIELIKTDENGNVAIDEEMIRPLNTLSCYPNPSHAQITIGYSIKIPSVISIDIYNIKGQKVETLIDNEQRYIGNYIAHWNGMDSYGSHLCTGTYFIRLQTNDNSITKKILLLK